MPCSQNLHGRVPPAACTAAQQMQSYRAFSSWEQYCSLQGDKIPRKGECSCPLSPQVPEICVFPVSWRRQSFQKEGFWRACSDREGWFAVGAASQEGDLRCLVCVGILDGEGEEMFAVVAPGLGHQPGVGKAAFGAALGGLEAKIMEVSFFLWVSGGLGWNMPFLPPFYASRDHQDFLHSPLLPTASQEKIHPFPLRPALGHLFCWLSAVPSLAYPQGAKPIFLEGFQPSCNFLRFIPHFPTLKKEGRLAAWGRRAGRTPGFRQRWICHHPAPAQRGRG